MFFFSRNHFESYCGAEELFVKGYRNVLRDSPNETLAGLMFAIMVVLELPPKLSFSNLQ